MWPPKLDLLINILIQQFFNSSSCFIVVSDSKFSLSLPSGSVVVNTDSSSISTTVFHNFGCQNFVLDVLDPVHTFELLEHEIRRHKESLHSRKYLIVTDGNLFSEVPLSVSCHGLLVNVSKFLTRAGKEEIESSIWKLQHLAQPQVLINKWFSINQSFLWNHTISHEEHSALKGYIIKVGTFDHPPYVVVRKNFGVDSCDIPDISGTEIEILKTIAQHLNIKLEFHLTSGLWGEIFHGKNASGLKGLIMKGVLDLGAGKIQRTKEWSLNKVFFGLSWILLNWTYLWVLGPIGNLPKSRSVFFGTRTSVSTQVPYILPVIVNWLMTASSQKRFDQIIVTHIGCGTSPSSLRVMVDAIVCLAY